MNPRSLETLLWVARLGGIGAAAERLNLTQPAVTRRIHELEDELGAKLFLRRGRGIVLSPVGRTCLEIAERIVAEVAELRNVASGRRAVSGTVRVGVGEVVALSWLYRLLDRMKAIYPNLNLDLDVELSSRLLKKLGSRELDLVLLPGPVTVPGAIAMRLGRYRLCWMSPPDFPNGNKPLGPSDLLDVPIITLSPDSHVSLVMENWFQSARVKPRRIHYCNSLSVIASLVSDGFGTSLLPFEIFESAVSAGTMKVLRVEPQVAAVEYWVAYLRTPETPILGEIAAIAMEESWFNDASRHQWGKLAKNPVVLRIIEREASS